MSRRPVQPVKRGRPAWVYWVAAAVGLVVLAIAGCFVAAAVVSRPPAAPGDWQSVESKTKKMTLQVPANWKWSTSGSEGTFEWVTVKPGGLYVIRIKGSAVKGSIGDIGSAMQRMASGDGGGEDLGVEMRAEGALHELLGEVEKKQDRHYRGTSDMQPCTFGGKPAAYSEYSTTKRIGIATVRLKGARMSVPAGDLGYDVRIICPTAHWDTFQPHASKLLESVQLR